MDKMIIEGDIKSTLDMLQKEHIYRRKPELSSGYIWGRRPLLKTSSTKHGRSEKQIKKDRKKKKMNRRKRK